MRDERIVLVTGGNRGIGKEVCRQLAAEGANVILTARNLAKGQAAADDIGLGVTPFELDVDSFESIRTLYEDINQQFSHIDVLINNAAINYDTWQRAVSADLDTVAETVHTNLYGPWHMIQTFLPLLRKSSHPRIVNVSSGAGALSAMNGGTPAYSISKLALNGLTMMMASELKGDRILVNAVCPGWVATDMGGSGGRPVADGARGIVWAASLPDGGPSGRFFRDGQEIEW